MKHSRFFLWALSSSLVTAIGCGGDGTTLTSSSGTTTSGSSSSGGEGGGGAGGGGAGTGGMAASSSSGMSSSSSSGMGGAGGMGTGGMGGLGGMGTGGMASGGAGGAGGGMGGSGGGAAMCAPEGPFDGAPVMAQANQWTWVSVPEAKCRNGSATGFGVRINPNSSNLVIYFQGGGACFNGLTCTANPSSYGANNFGNGPSGGLFDSNNNANPLKDWNFVYLPYCTGDVFTGNATGVDVPGFGAPQNQSFVGYANVGFYLKRIIPTFPDVNRVLVTGESAGGFGAFYNYDRIAQAFCPKPVDLIDDSGPPMTDMYMAPCLQQRWRTLYNMNGTLPKDCTDCALPNGGGLANAWKLLAEKYPTANLGLVSSNRDSTIRQFYGFGQNNCQSLDGFAASLSEAAYSAGLTEIRDLYLKPSPAWSTFFVNSTSHTYLGGNSYYNTTVAGTSLTSWVDGIVNGAAAAHIGP